VELWVDTRLVSEANVREHWTRTDNRARRQRELVAMTFLQALGARWHLEAEPTRPKRVHFTAYVGRPFDDDNLIGALKHVRDGLIDARLIRGDAPADGHVFSYEQRTGIPTAQQGVRISVRLRNAPEDAP
jgi:hypothetical protein